MKKGFAMLLVLTMAVSMIGITGASAETNEFGWEIPAETLTVSVFYNSDQFTMDEQQTVGLENMKKFLLEKFNVNYEVKTTDGDADEELNLMLASGTYPGVIIGASTINRQKFVDQKRAANITEYVNQSPNLLKRMGGMIGLYADADDNIFYLPSSYNNLMDLPDYSAHLRYDEWLEIGSPKVETPQDWYDAVMAIYEKHPTTDEGEQRYTLSLYSQGLPEYISGYWGLQRGWKVNDDNTLTYWTHTDEGKAMAEFFNNWWRTGTMDPDSMTNAWNDARTKVTQERVIALIGGWWIGYNAGHEVWMLTDDDWTENKRFFQVGFKAPEAENAYVTLKNNAGSSWTIITDKCEDVEGVMKWLDFTQTDVGIALTSWGMPNEIASYKNPGTFTEIWHLNEDGTWYFNETAKQQLLAETWDYQEEGIYGVNTGVFSLSSYKGRFDDGIHCLWPNQMWYSENQWKQIMFENMSGTIFDGTALLFESLTMDQDVTFAKTAVTDAWKQFYPLCIMAGSDDEFEAAWTALQEAVEAAGLETYTDYFTENYQFNVESMN